ncbi:MAG: pilus assembly protein [Planctomycetes bacterium]|nr:pilus assembly protein [Planctomycetota bacterium]
MIRSVIVACIPWLAILIAALACAVLLVRLGGHRPRWRRLRQLHGDQQGAVQSLSFVLTLPLFMMIMMFIVQVSQLMIATVVVHYAAFAAARSAIVWIPARVVGQREELENCIGERRLADFDEALDPDDLDFWADDEGVPFEIVDRDGTSPKFARIRAAAMLACVPICPSRDLGLEVPAEEATAAEIFKRAYATVASGGLLDPEDDRHLGAIHRRLENKLAYSSGHTHVGIRFLHKSDEPWLRMWDLPDDREEFRENEVGWQDPITVTVTHDLALLPGPGRFLARDESRSASGSSYAGSGGYTGVDTVAPNIRRDEKAKVHVYPITASITLGNEGQKPVLSFVHGDFRGVPVEPAGDPPPCGCGSR